MRQTVRRNAACALIAALALAFPPPAGFASTQAAETLMLRGRAQLLHLYGPSTGDPLIVSSGDGGWMHLGPHVAQTLAANGFFVVGFDVKEYLGGFTSGSTTLRLDDEPRDYRLLADFASRVTHKKPILIGVSEGAGLSVLAATDPRMKQAIAGVIGLGLPNVNELGWRWKDAVIWLTHGVPNEPTFRTADWVARMTPVPLAVIHSTHDEFVPLPEVRAIFNAAAEPKKLWIVEASNHRFANNLPEFDRRLTEAIAWVNEQAPR